MNVKGERTCTRAPTRSLAQNRDCATRVCVWQNKKLFHRSRWLNFTFSGGILHHRLYTKHHTHAHTHTSEYLFALQYASGKFRQISDDSIRKRDAFVSCTYTYYLYARVYLPSFSIFSFWRNNDRNNQSMSLAVYLPQLNWCKSWMFYCYLTKLFR